MSMACPCPSSMPWMVTRSVSSILSWYKGWGMVNVEMEMSRDWQRCNLMLSTLPGYSDNRLDNEEIFRAYLYKRPTLTPH